MHFGSLVAALASWLDARAVGGRWLLRIEDVDAPRCSSLHAEGILRTLGAFGLDPDGEVVWQTRRTEAYVAALEQLRSGGHVYPCACTRKELADSRLGPDGAAIYPGTCRNGVPTGRSGRAWRFAVDDERIELIDRIQPPTHWRLAKDCGDFVVRRADGLFAYQLAVVVDDAAAGVTDVVRGADLFHSTPRQIALQRALGWPTPRYAHLPVATNAAGEKLSKQTLACAVDPSRPGPALSAALRFLGQAPPAELERASANEVLTWASAHWDLARIPHLTTLSAPADA